jgi:hypothetical protein
VLEFKVLPVVICLQASPRCLHGFAPPATTSARVKRLVERAMAFAMEQYGDDDLAVACQASLAHDD